MLRIVIPSLFWLEDKELQSQSIYLKNWNMLFKRAEVSFSPPIIKNQKFVKSSNKNTSSPLYTYSDFFYKMLYPDCSGSLADYLANKQGLSGKYPKFLIVEPTNLRVDIDRLLISEPSLLQLNQETAKNIINSINQHFVDILEVYYISESLWLCGISSELYNSASTKGIFYSVLDIIGCNINDYLPSGVNATEFTRLLNEMQMLLFNLPINQPRLGKNLPIINSLWFWDKHLDKVQINSKTENIIYPINLKAGLRCHSRVDGNPEKFQPSSLISIVSDILDFERYLDNKKNQDTVLILDELYLSYCKQDVHAWLQKITQYDQIIANLLVTKLLSGEISNLQIIIPLNPHINGTISVKISKYDKYKIYRYHSVKKILREIL